MELRADAELDARELIALKLIYYALYSVVTAVRAFAAYSEPAAGERDVVENDDYLFGRYLVERGYVAHRLAGVVHECLGFCENAALAADFRVAYEGVELQAVYFYIVLLREKIEAEEAGIVAGEFIFLARVAEPDYQKFGRADSAGSASEKIHIFFPYIFYTDARKPERPYVILTLSELYIDREFVGVCHVKFYERLVRGGLVLRKHDARVELLESRFDSVGAVVALGEDIECECPGFAGSDGHIVGLVGARADPDVVRSVRFALRVGDDYRSVAAVLY